MKLIIDIPDHLYNVIKNKECTNKNVLTKAVENGTPIPDNATVCDIDAIRAEPKTGHWIEHKNNGMSYIECSKCSTWFLRMYLTRNSYCPNCGTRMVEPQEVRDE